MTLQKRVIPSPFASGLDTKTNPQLSQGPLVLENAVFNLRGKAQKRNGYTALGTSVLNAAGGSGDPLNLTSPQALGIFNTELVSFANGDIYGYSTSNDAWVNKKDAFSVKVTKADVIKNTFQQSASDANTLNNVSVYVWQDSRAGIRYSVVDEITGNNLVSDISLSSTGVNPKVIICGIYIFIHYVEGTNLKQIRIDPLNPTVLPAAVTLVNDVKATTTIFDLETISSAMIFTYVNTAGNMKLGYITQNQQVGNGINGYPTPVTVTQTPTNAISVHYNNGTLIFVASFDSAAGTKVTRYHLDLSLAVATAVVDATTTITTAITMSTLNANTVMLFYTLSAMLASNTLINLSQIGLTGAPNPPSVFIRSVGLASKSFIINGRIYFCAVFDSPLQPTYFMIRDDAYITARFLNGIAGGLPAATSMLPEYARLTSTTGFVALGQKGPLLTEVGKAFSLIGVEKIALDFANSNQFSSIQVGKNLHIIGGFLQNYDGTSVTEHGFHIYPEGVTAVTGVAGALTGNYAYIATYEWTDAQGQIHRSATSVPALVTLAAQKATVTIPTLRLTAKKGLRTNVVIAIYRTKNNGTVYYRTSSIASPIYSDPTIDSVTFTDNNTDAQIAGDELLYTTGGIVDNIAAPACQFIRSFNNRVIISGLEDPTQLWFSKPFTIGSGIGFSDQFTKQVDAEGGNITALGNMDDKIIIFKAAQIFFISGDGPNDTGQQDNFTLPQKISSDVGCANQNSIVTGPDGLYFQSSKGIYLLDRTLKVSYVGEGVERYNNLVINSATLLQSVNELRFTTSGGDTLVYNYFFNQWSTFTKHTGIDAKLWQGIYTYINSTGRVFKETIGAFLDNYNKIKLKIITPWFSFAGVQAFARCYQIDLLGEYHGPHKLIVSVGYNFQPYFPQSINFQSDTIFAGGYYGSDAYYGASSPYGGEEIVYQYRINPIQQKIESIRLQIEDVYAGTGTEAYSLSGLSFEIGIKQGVMKIPVAKAGG